MLLKSIHSSWYMYLCGCNTNNYLLYLLLPTCLLGSCLQQFLLVSILEGVQCVGNEEGTRGEEGGGRVDGSARWRGGGEGEVELMGVLALIISYLNQLHHCLYQVVYRLAIVYSNAMLKQYVCKNY